MIDLYGIATEADVDGQEFAIWRLFKLIRTDNGGLVWQQLSLGDMKPLINGRILSTEDTKDLQVVLEHYGIGYDAYLGWFPHNEYYIEVPYKEEDLL